MKNLTGPEDRIRTCGIMVPNHALYQAELHPDVPYQYSRQVCWAFARLIWAVINLPIIQRLLTKQNKVHVICFKCLSKAPIVLITRRELGGYIHKEQ